MKKIYAFLASAVFASVNLVAQSPTINTPAIPQVGYVYMMASDTAISDLPTFTISASSGTAQNWNYSSQFTNIYGETTTFTTTSSGQGASNFPNAQMAINQNGTWVYLKTGGGLMIDGVYINQQGTSFPLDFTPDAPELPVPFTYPNSTTVTYSASTSFTYSSIPVQVKHHAIRTVTADAFGTVTTPSGTFNNVLRVKTREESIDSIIPQYLIPTQVQTDTTTNYTWYQNTPDALQLSIDLDKTGAVTKAQYLQSFSNGVAQIAQPNIQQGVYPNPANSVVNLTYQNLASGQTTVQLFDMDGRLVANLLDENQPSGMQQISVNIARLHLAAGFYHLTVTNSAKTQNFKLTIN